MIKYICCEFFYEHPKINLFSFHDLGRGAIKASYSRYLWCVHIFNIRFIKKKKKTENEYYQSAISLSRLWLVALTLEWKFIILLKKKQRKIKRIIMISHKNIHLPSFCSFGQSSFDGWLNTIKLFSGFLCLIVVAT